MKNKFNQIGGSILVLSTLFVGTACDNSTDDIIEELAPLSCTIPGDIRLNVETKSVLDKYKKSSI